MSSVVTDVAIRSERPPCPPWWVARLTPLVRLLLRVGVPLGPNALITIRGRKTGLQRTTPLAIVEFDGRRWIWAPWGDVHWVRNLRSAGRATIRQRGVTGDVRATELDRAQRIAFFRETLATVASSIPFGTWFVRTVDGVDLRDPVAASQGRAVFELHPLGGSAR